MPSHDAKRAPAGPSESSESLEPSSRRLSRRSLLQGAATAGAAGLAATAIGAPALAATSREPAEGRPRAPLPAGPLPAGPIMVHVRDARSGDIELFAGTSQTRLRDKDLAARIARAFG
jgi:hypothetical protein